MPQSYWKSVFNCAPISTLYNWIHPGKNIDLFSLTHFTYLSFTDVTFSKLIKIFALYNYADVTDI